MSVSPLPAYMEISPLFETQWTGIPAVVAGIARLALRDSSIEWKFFFQSIEVPNSVIKTMIANNSGHGGHQYLHHISWTNSDIDAKLAERSKAIFLNIKTVRGFFLKEAMFIHDLTPLLVPIFHNIDSINHFSDRIRRDVETSSQFFCNSESTREDLVQYLNVDRCRTIVVPLGADIAPESVSVGQLIRQTHDVEPYIVVIGTLEPRKNGKAILEFLTMEPGFADRFRIVFVGRDGWLEERARLLNEIARAGISQDRIVFTGFVSELEKIALIQNSSFCVYPSFYEGYGLPIKEAASLGKLVVCSNTSSMVEVAPNYSMFFNPFDIVDFWRVMKLAEQRCQQISSTKTLSDIETKLAKSKWDVCYNAVSAWVKQA
jgi:glycosyltransferase involved in cell wall biosynthesis